MRTLIVRTKYNNYPIFIGNNLLHKFDKYQNKYLKNIKIPKYGIWAMTKNKEPDLFIKQLKGIFKKVVTMPIENESNSVSAHKLYKIAIKNKFKAEKSNSFSEALKKISSKEKKLIVCFGSLYNCGNILNKN